ncbi:7328_t:CDS:2 [Ambispora gerdemannii]|uniref:7328_t:CDS:1 n=1 Tax=Ambispora gerdemannii TaxID=144530 RepID=A0A9N8VJ75_9GLOM|nr:7328_t:CDS:2 [Ambispora gerdemannii]
MSSKVQDEKPKHVIAVSATDRWVGNSIGHGLLKRENNDNDKETEIIALTRDPRSSNVKKLEKEGAKIRETNYKKKESLEQAVQGVNTLVYVAEDDKNCVRFAEDLVKAAKSQQVSNVILFSFIGADEELTETHRSAHNIEKVWEKEFQSCKIIRVNWAHQYFLDFAKNIQEEGVLKMTLDTESERLAPIDVQDIICVIEDLAKKQENRETEQKNIYNLTGSKAFTPKDLVIMINEVIKTGKVEYRQVCHEKLAQYLKMFGRDGTDSREEYDPRRFLPYDSFEIEKILDLLSYAKNGRDAGKSFDDFKEITGKEPKPIDYFFKENADEFTPKTKNFFRGRRSQRFFSRL